MFKAASNASMLVAAAVLCLTAFELRAGGQAPVLDLEGVADPEVSRALRTAYNLPAWMEGAGGETSSVASFEVVETERSRLTALMVSFGYLDAEVLVVGSGTAGWTRLLPVTHERYRVGTITLTGLRGTGLEEEAIDDLASVIPIYTGRFVTASLLSDIEDSVVFRLRERSYALAAISARNVAGDRSTGLAEIVLDVDVGPPARFGPVTFQGLRRTAGEDLHHLVPFAPGYLFIPSKLDLLHRNLEASELFARIRVDTPSQLNEEGLLPVRVRLTEKRGAAVAVGSAEAGIGAAVLTLVVLALRQIGLAAGARRRLVHTATDLAILLAPIFAGFTLFRLLQFLG